MDKAEAEKLAAARLAELRAVPFLELVERLVGREETGEVIGRSGARYQVEVQALWDRGEGENLRVIVSVDDGDLRAFAPVSEDFIVAPDGSFVGDQSDGCSSSGAGVVEPGAESYESGELVDSTLVR